MDRHLNQINSQWGLFKKYVLRIFLLFLILLFGGLFFLKIFGLPSSFKTLLIKEIQQKSRVGVFIEHLGINWYGACIAENFIIYRTLKNKEVLARVDRMKISIEWFAWTKGKPIIKRVSLSNGDIFLPLSKNTLVPIKNVYLETRFTEDKAWILARGRLINLEWSIKGDLLLNGILEGPSRKKKKELNLERFWVVLKKNLEELDPSHPLRIDASFSSSTRAPEQTRGQFIISSKHTQWKGIPIREVQGIVTLKNQKLLVPSLEVKLLRGSLQFFFNADLKEKVGFGEFNSFVDFSFLANVFPKKIKEQLKEIRFTELPILKGSSKFQWKETPSFNLQSTLSCENFSYRNVSFDSLSLPLGFDGLRLLISHAELKQGKDSLSFNLLRDHEKKIRGRAISTLNPKVFLHLFGGDIDLFLSSLNFFSVSPELEISLKTKDANLSSFELQGKGMMKDFSYKGIRLKKLSSSFVINSDALHLKDFFVERKEGTLHGDISEYFKGKERLLKIKNLHSTLNVLECAGALGDKFLSYVTAYRFITPPKLFIEGVVDLGDEEGKKKNDLRVNVEALDGMVYDVLNVPLRTKNQIAEIRLIDEILSVELKTVDVCEGTLTGMITVNIEEAVPPLTIDITLKKGRFETLLETFFQNKDSRGEVSLHFKIKGPLDVFEKFTGEGWLKVRDGYILDIPFLGVFSELFDKILPIFGNAKADSAQCTFKIKDGKIISKDIDIASALFVIIGNGHYDFIKDDLDIYARANGRSVFGLFLFPVSKIFEYQGRGPIKDIQWTPVSKTPQKKNKKKFNSNNTKLNPSL